MHSELQILKVFKLALRVLDRYLQLLGHFLHLTLIKHLTEKFGRQPSVSIFSPRQCILKTAPLDYNSGKGHWDVHVNMQLRAFLSFCSLLSSLSCCLLCFLRAPHLSVPKTHQLLIVAFVAVMTSGTQLDKSGSGV